MSAIAYTNVTGDDWVMAEMCDRPMDDVSAKVCGRAAVAVYVTKAGQRYPRCTRHDTGRVQAAAKVMGATRTAL